MTKRDEREDAWEALAAGELSKEERGVLRALAATEADDETQREALEPLSDAAKARITEDLLSRAARPRRRRPPAWTVSVGLAAAAALTLALWPWDPTPDALAYSLELSGGLQRQRSEPQAGQLPSYDGASELQLVLRPQRGDGPPPQVAAYLVRGAEIRPWPIHFERAASGAMRARGPAKELLPAQGRWTVAIVIAPELPDEDEQLRWIRARDPRVLRADLIRVP